MLILKLNLEMINQWNALVHVKSYELTNEMLCNMLCLTNKPIEYFETWASYKITNQMRCNKKKIMN